MTLLTIEDRDDMLERELLAIEKELKEDGCYCGLKGVELTWEDWVQIQSESKDLTAALQAACDTITALYEQRK